jgi:NH3-dependent NAD+ synthetase
MLTLESTMLTTFGTDTMDMGSRKLMLGLSGGAISAFIIAMAVYMIVQATKKINIIQLRKETNGE